MGPVPRNHGADAFGSGQTKGEIMDFHDAEVPTDKAAPLPPAREILAVARGAVAARRRRSSDDISLRRQQLDEQFTAWRDEPLAADTLDRIIETVERAAAQGEMLAHVYRFPSDYCTDRGRAVNNEEPDWPHTLQGPARTLFVVLQECFEPLGYRIGAAIVTWPLLMPGDVSLFLSWQE